MKYLLDTNIFIHFFKGQYNLFDKILKIGYDNVGISEITLAELIYGAENSLNIEKNMKIVDDFAKNIEILPLMNCLKMYGKEKARFKSIGRVIGDFDLLIGSTAVVNNMIMVTRNTKEFERISDIKLENWIDDK